MNFDRQVLIVPLGPIIIEPASPRNSLQILLVTFESTHILVLAANDPVAVLYIAISIIYIFHFFSIVLTVKVDRMISVIVPPCRLPTLGVICHRVHSQ